MKRKQTTVGIYIFDEVEVLDFAGPFEVFAVTQFPDTAEKPFLVKTVSQFGNSIQARNGLKVQADYSFNDAPAFDILIIPGGYGAEELEIRKPEVITWIKQQYQQVSLLCSVCTGAFLLAEAKVLNGKRATTHWIDIDRLEREYREITVLRNKRYVDEGDIVTSGGISSGIHMSLHVVRRLINKDIANYTAKRMEYEAELD